MHNVLSKIFTASFWLVVAIHVGVFASIGFIEGRWRLLIVFVGILIPTIILKAILTVYAWRHPEKERLRRILRVK